MKAKLTFHPDVGKLDVTAGPKLHLLKGSLPSGLLLRSIETPPSLGLNRSKSRQHVSNLFKASGAWLHSS